MPGRALALLVVAAASGLAPSAAAAGHTTALAYSSGPLQVAVPDHGEVTQPLVVAQPGRIASAQVFVRLRHRFVSELAIDLSSPSGRRVLLSAYNGGARADFGAGPEDCDGTATRFTDTAVKPVIAASAPFAGSFQPETPLATLRGDTAAGVWTLRIRDALDGDAGQLLCWGDARSDIRRARRPHTRALVRTVPPRRPESPGPLRTDPTWGMLDRLAREHPLRRMAMPDRQPHP
jgi:hypothetical protein